MLLLSIHALQQLNGGRGAAMSSSGGGIRTRFVFAPNYNAVNKPKLVLIGGATGTGKSTFGMSVALDQGIMKCVSTDTVRSIMRSFTSPDASPALYRSSYSPAFENDDPVEAWKETCAVLEQVSKILF